MTITIAPELEEQLRERAAIEGLTIEAYVERLIREDEEWRERVEEPLDESNPEFDEVHSAVMQGLEEAERGEGTPAKDVFADLRAKHGISR
jgi:hypothetical protein